MRLAYSILFKSLNFFIKVLGIVMVLSIVLQITGRYVSMLSFAWTEELARLTFIWFCFIGIAIAYDYKIHMSIDYFCLKLNKKLQKLIYLFCTVLIFIFSLIITYYGTIMTAMVKVQISPMLNLPFSWFYAAVPVGFGLIAIFSIKLIVESFLSSDKNETVNIADGLADK